MRFRSRLAAVAVTAVILGLVAEYSTTPVSRTAAHVISRGADHVSPTFVGTASSSGAAVIQTPTGINAGKWFSGLVVCSGGQGLTTWTVTNQQGQPIGQAQGAAPYIGPIFVAPGGILTFTIANALPNASLSVTLYGFTAVNPADLPVLPPLAGQSTIGFTQQPWSYPNQPVKQTLVNPGRTLTISPAATVHLFLFLVRVLDGGVIGTAGSDNVTIYSPDISHPMDSMWLTSGTPQVPLPFLAVDLGAGNPLLIKQTAGGNGVAVVVILSTSDGSAPTYTVA